MKGLLHLFRWGGAAILLLAFVAVGALCLWAGLVLGAGFVRTGSSFMETAWIPEELRRNADDLVSVMPLAAAVLAAMHGGLPILFTRFSTSIVRFLEECLKLPAGGHSWWSAPGRAGLLPSFVVPFPHLRRYCPSRLLAVRRARVLGRRNARGSYGASRTGTIMNVNVGDVVRLKDGRQGVVHRFAVAYQHSVVVRVPSEDEIAGVNDDYVHCRPADLVAARTEKR